MTPVSATAPEEQPPATQVEATGQLNQLTPTSHEAEANAKAAYEKPLEAPLSEDQAVEEPGSPLLMEAPA
jgi:hypothetical protein